MGVTGRYANGTVPVIMVVDDTDSARILLVRALQLAKLNAIGAADAYEALTLLERHRPSLLLLDLSMPDRDGFQLLADVRSDPRWRRLPIVVYSALSDRESIRRATELGATDYIVKASLPFREVIDRLRRYLPLSAEGGK
jgi:CheY-like chemotaxis protein